jgi:integrase
MTTLERPTATLWRPADATPFDEAQLAAAAFLARYRGRTLDAYRHDLRAFFQWASDNQLLVLEATRPRIELDRAAMEQRGLAASTIDRRLSTVCGFYRFAHIDGRIVSNPAQYVRRPKVQPSEGHGMDRAELGMFLFTAERFDRDHAALAVLLGLNGLRCPGFDRGRFVWLSASGLLGPRRGHFDTMVTAMGRRLRSLRRFQRGGTGVVVDGGGSPHSDWLGGSRTGVPSGVVWLLVRQLGVWGVEEQNPDHVGT